MQLEEHQRWLVDFYKGRNWYRFSPLIRLNFMTEDLGELSRAVRALEIGRDHPGEHIEKAGWQDNLVEEMADVMDQLLILADKFDIKPEQLMQQSERKLQKRFEEK